MTPKLILEALAAGVPSISTDCPCGAPAMLIENGKNGLLVGVGDAHAMADSIGCLLQKPDFAAEMGAEASRRAMAYSENRIYPAWEEFCFPD